MGRTKGKVVMVFGVFDGLHEGHVSFLEQAQRYGETLVVAVARDVAARELKNKLPTENERVRLARVRKIQGVSVAIVGDRTQGSYGVIKKFQPDIICLGYDQDALASDIRGHMAQGIVPQVKLVRLEAHQRYRDHP